MDDVTSSIELARLALQSGDFESALTLLQKIDSSDLEPHQSIEVIQATGQCLRALGRHTENIALHQDALSQFLNQFFATPASVKRWHVEAALKLSIGARNENWAGKLLRIKFPAFFATAREIKISPVCDLQSWCRAQNIDVHTLDPVREVDVQDKNGISRAFRYQSEETWHATIPNAGIVMGWDFVISPSGEVLEGANYMPINTRFPFMPHSYYEQVRLVAHVHPAESICHDIEALFISTPESHHFGHWIADFLPRLRVWKQFGVPRQKLVISSSLPRKHRDMLACFGVKGEDLLECDLGCRYKFRSLSVVKSGISSRPNPQHVQFLYEHFRPRLNGSVGSHGKLAFFLTRDAGTRVPSNEDELEAVLQEFGVIRINPAKLSYEEQATLFANTGIIIGAFGTELYCLLNMQLNSTVIELAWDEDSATVYGPICSLLGIRHHLIVCGAVENTQTKRRKLDRDLIVDCTELRKRLSAHFAL